MTNRVRGGLVALALAGGLDLALHGQAAAEGAHSEHGYLLPTTGAVVVPVTVGGNVVGTPAGPLTLPAITTGLDTRSLTDPLDPAYEKLYETSMPLHPAWPTPDHPDPEHVGGFAHLDHEQVNVVVPVNVSGNALALGGNATTDTGGTAVGAAPSPVDTSGYGGFVSGNEVAVDGALPVSVSGNALGLAGNARTTGSSDTSALAGGPVATEGENGVVSGNIVAVPVSGAARLTGNSASLLGGAESTGQHRVGSTAGGATGTTRGSDPLSGNVERLGTTLEAGLEGLKPN
jgi:trimeric autotransporter adhesin